MHGAEPLDELGLQLGVAEPAGHDDDVGRGDVGERLRGDEPGPAGVVDDRTRLGGDEHDLVAGHVGEDLEGSDDVEHREVRVEGEGDLHLASSGLGAVGSGACHALILGLRGPVGHRARPLRFRCSGHSELNDDRPAWWS